MQAEIIPFMKGGFWTRALVSLKQFNGQNCANDPSSAFPAHCSVLSLEAGNQFFCPDQRWRTRNEDLKERMGIVRVACWLMSHALSTDEAVQIPNRISQLAWMEVATILGLQVDKLGDMQR